MKRSDISDLTVIEAYDAAKILERPVLDVLMSLTGAPEKVCWRAMERAEERGYLDYGTSLNSAWVTDKGRELLIHRRHLDAIEYAIRNIIMFKFPLITDLEIKFDSEDKFTLIFTEGNYTKEEVTKFLNEFIEEQKK